MLKELCASVVLSGFLMGGFQGGPYTSAKWQGEESRNEEYLPAQDPPPPPVAMITRCKLKRDSSGSPFLRVEGRLFAGGAIVTVAGGVPRKVKFKNPAP